MVVSISSHNDRTTRLWAAPVPKIAQLVADTKAQLERLGIDTEGKRPEEILRMAREQRNRPLLARWRRELMRRLERSAR
jgi:hypothetical protein